MFNQGHVLITGALGGLGTAIVKRLLDEGANVIATDRRADDVNAWRQHFGENAQSRLDVRTLDVTRDEDVNTLSASLRKAGIHVAYLINNAGVAGGGDPSTMATKTFEIVLRVNLHGTFFCTRAFSGEMRERGFGRIVNFASLYAYQPGPGQAPYAAAKAGIVGYTHSIARDLAPFGVTVNVLAPGLIWHPRLAGVLPDAEFAAMRESTPMQRAGKPEEIAGVIHFLLSPDASYVTGQTIHVNGGVYMSG